jgi:hypothetical protein
MLDLVARNQCETSIAEQYGLYNSIHSGFPDNGLGMNSLIKICEFAINGNMKTMMIFIKKATS